MKSILIEAHYLPSLAYFAAISQTDKIVIEKHENYVKQSFRNRCHIKASHSPITLTVPLTNKHGKVLMRDVKIDYRQKWLNNHWRTIQSAYGKAPFFEYYADDLHAVLFKQFEFLYDLNFNLLSMCLKWLKWEKSIYETLTYNNEAFDVTDMRNVINCKKQEENIKYLSAISYTQVFGNMFVPNLSIIDLVFCTGPQANGYVAPSGSRGF